MTKFSAKSVLLNTLSISACALATQANAQTDNRPNVLVILADDLGYSDLGCYGSEIQTPNLDQLAKDGMRFTRFYNSGRSCPTRASLLTGLNPHQAGIGRMTFNENLPGYRGQLTENTVTIPEALKTAGYRTGMVGKWHVSETPLRPDQRQWLAHHVQYDTFADLNTYPTRRGFEEFYGIIYGVVDYFDPFSLVNGETPVNEVPKNYYITNALSDTTVAYLNRYAKNDQPFFLYLSYTSPHWPLHALEEDIKKYEDVYKSGWDDIRNARYERLKQSGLFDKYKDYLTARNPNKDWDKNPDKEYDARAMAVHAAMIDRMDQCIGKVIAALKANGQLDNTLILFMSDNGCSPEVCQNYSPGENDRPDMLRDGTPMIYPRKKEALPGPENVYASLGPEWANVADTPFRFWKASMYEGGICTPMIAHWPKGMKKTKGTTTDAMCHVMDIMATCLDLSGAKYPKEYKGHDIIPLEGKSMVPVLKKGKGKARELGFEHFGQKAYMSADGWKIVKGKEWELYNLNEDRTEMHNVAAQHPKRVAEMVKKYEDWEKRCLVVPAP